MVKKKGIEQTVKILFDHYSLSKSISKSNKILYIEPTNSIRKNLLKLYNENCKILINKSNKNINIGGDHSMAIGSIGASLNIYGSKLKVLWFDAHADINTRRSSPSGNLHGMPLSFLTGLDSDPENFPYISNLLPLENLYYIGIRDLDSEEINIIKKFNIKVMSSDEHNFCGDKSIQKIIDWVKDDPVHISFDIDSLDPKYMQCTGTKSPDGLDLVPFVSFLTKICNKCNIVNVDISELNLFVDKKINNSIMLQNLNNFNIILNVFKKNI